ncbi:MAG: cysteine--tRNA ligase [Dehalococcoidia bacterium]|jgi:cysteinyl-tRNA synthetase|nr:cysteine--tRNA ligase [Dehalococcoidia bacterium]
MLRISNTLSGVKEDFEPYDPKQVRVYVCGITPYAESHIGHGMSYVVFDVIRRYLEYRGYGVKVVQNFTDVDDKIIDRADTLGISAEELAGRYIDRFFEDMDLLHVRRADEYPRATQEVPSIVQMISGLIDKGFAYHENGDVYFRVRSQPGYGKLSHRTLDGMVAGARVAVSETKEHPLDFALWKSAKPGEPSWESAWGPGRPGWHIECSAMSLNYLGEALDIHGGGQDLVFPHHENEIAQSEAFTGVTPFAKYWMHNGLLRMGEEKMSKSTGNLVTIREVVESHGSDAFRVFVLMSHYRSPLSWSEEGLASAGRATQRLVRAVSGPENGPVTERESGLEAQPFREQFEAAMDDDFNTSQAIAVLFDLAREINKASGRASEAQATLLELAGLLGLTLTGNESDSNEAGPFIELLIETRAALRKERQFALADQVRDRLIEMGVALEDTANGTEWGYRRS